MKSYLLKASIISTLCLNLYAGENFIKLGASSQDFDGATNSGITLGIGTDNYKESGLYYGAVFNLESSELETEQVIGLGMDLNLGYQLTSDLVGYGIIGWNMQSIYDSDESEFNSYKGFGGGIGAQYKISESFAINVEARSYTLKYEEVGNDLDYKSTNFNLKWIY